jgi:hypothetical protein
MIFSFATELVTTRLWATPTMQLPSCLLARSANSVFSMCSMVSLGFVNAGRGVLLSEFLETLPTDSFMIEILEGVDNRRRSLSEMPCVAKG